MTQHATPEYATDDLAPELRLCIAENDAIVADARDLVGSVTAEQFNWRPDAKRWSIGDCLEHLTMTLDLYLPVYRNCMEEARRRGQLGSGPYRYGWFSGRFVASMEPPPKIKVKARLGIEVTGLSTHEPADILRAFEERHAAFVALIRETNGVDLKRPRLTSLFSKFVSMPLGQWYRFNAAHDRRHLWQARQVMKAPGFPQ